MTIQNSELKSYSNFDLYHQHRENGTTHYNFLDKKFSNYLFETNQGAQKLDDIGKQSSSTIKTLAKSKIPVYRQCQRTNSWIERKTSETFLKDDSTQHFYKDQSRMAEEINKPRESNRTAIIKSKFGRSKSMNYQKPINTNQTINFSSFSIQSASLSDSLSDSTSNLSLNIIQQKSFGERTKSLLASLDRIETSFSVDSFYQFLTTHFKQTETDMLTVRYLESHLFNCSSQIKRKGVRSPSIMQSTPVERQVEGTPPIGFIYDLNGKNLIDENGNNSENSSFTCKQMNFWFKNMQKFRKFYNIVQKDIINELISLELETLPNEYVLSRTVGFPSIFSNKNQDEYFKRLTKYHGKLLDINQSLCVLIKEKSVCSYELLSKHSVLANKYQNPRQFEYILRLTNDVVYKMKTIIRLCEKCYELCKNIKDKSTKFKPVNKPKSPGLKKSLSVQYPVAMKKNTELDTIVRPKLTIDDSEICKKGYSSEKFYAIEVPKKNNESTRNIPEYPIMDISEAEIKNMDSFIRETDCSSFLSNDEDDSLPNSQNHLNSQKRLKALREELKLVRRRIDSTNKSIDDLHSYLQNLLERAERCEKLRAQMKSDKELIRKTERNLKYYLIKKMHPPTSSSVNAAASNYDSVCDDLFQEQLNKQLDYLKYRYKLNSQDFSIEKMCAPEINAAIFDIEQRLLNEKSQLSNLHRYMAFVESKLVINEKGNSKVNNKTACIRRHPEPIDLPSLPHFTQIANQ